jgi:hypothetical protein
VIGPRSAVLDHLEEDALDWHLSQRRIAVKLADELSPRAHVLSTCFWMVFGDRADAARCSRNGRDGESMGRRSSMDDPFI